MIVALIIMIFIEFKDRGVIFGYPSPYQLRKYQDAVWMSPVYILRKYHGYFIYWAVIFTFWYHPMENTFGHAFGFAHTWFLMLQGSLTFTNLHLNKYWRFTLEVWVTLHSGVVAVQTVPNIMGKEIWPMFVFGFAMAIILTQLYGLPFWKNIPSWTRAMPVAVYTIIVVTSYSFIRDVQGRPFTRLQEIIRIPGIYYLILLIGWLIIVAIAKLQRISAAKGINFQESKEGAPSPPPRWKEVLVLLATVTTYAVSVFLSWILEYIDLKINLVVLSFIYCFGFTLISAVFGSFLLEMVIPLRRARPSSS
ncbi:hypothetical protein EB796_024698 [Bugula neritina]|uniref:Uncharacterized protein n=1 Tax=Bugula neritina TaxID=10212 RepID=A0A7J7ITU6_BUGNE|nr:hypothetical protein EB796_024698 [Bugula neritina]